MGALTVLCSVGTTHPWNIAGVGLDARVAQRMDARHVSVIAGVSAQGGGESAGAATPPGLLAAQLRAIRDVKPDAYRIGALFSAANVEVVAEFLQHNDVPVVCDPVIVASGGLVLAEPAAIDVMRSKLFRLCTLVTPNLDEASRLCGFPVSDRATMDDAARTLVQRDGAHAALVTGGHLPDEASDVLHAGGESATFEGGRLPGGMRGTGCALAAAAAIGMARGLNLRDAISGARAIVRDAIEHAIEWRGERVWPW
jgi:hydroxymethylpyrimidine/phosphomethylpyrimidine kinase